MVALLLSACSGLPKEESALLHGHLELEVEPNPLVARPLGDDVYEFAFDIIMRERGGVDVRIEDFTVEAIAFKTIPVRSQTYPASFITSRGYPADIAAGKYLRFSFVKRWKLPTDLLLSGASARITARTVDRDGRRNTSELRVGVVVRE
jgi:hypothetical protein